MEGGGGGNSVQTSLVFKLFFNSLHGSFASGPDRLVCAFCVFGSPTSDLRSARKNTETRRKRERKRVQSEDRRSGGKETVVLVFSGNSTL